MALEFVDLVALSKAKDGGKLDINSRDVFLDPYSRVRLEEAGLIDTKGVLTKKGKKTFKRVQEMAEGLREGVPFEDRPEREGLPTIYTTAPWFVGNACKEMVVSNGELLIQGKPYKWMEAKPAMGDKKLVFQRVVDAGAVAVSTLLRPHTYQMLELGGVEVIWMTNREQDVWVAIQAGYYDVVMKRYGKAKFFLAQKGTVVQARVRNHGLKNSVVALVSHLDMNGIEHPKPRKGWNE